MAWWKKKKEYGMMENLVLATLLFLLGGVVEFDGCGRGTYGLGCGMRVRERSGGE